MKYVPPQFDTESSPFSYEDTVKKAKRRKDLIMKSEAQQMEFEFDPNGARSCSHPGMREED